MTERSNCAAILSRNGGPRIARPGRSRAYDLVMRLPILLWSTALAFNSAASLQHFMRTADPALPGAALSIMIAMRLSVIAYLVILAATMITRRTPIGKARGLEPRISALAGTFLVTAILLFPRRELSLPSAIASTILILVCDGLAVITLIQLRRSFSVMPEARELVTSGVYHFVRHPLYLAEEIAAIGSIMQFLSAWTVLLLAVHIAFQFRRMWNEEAILSAVFPLYPTYQEETAQIIPGIY
jgi:protein-S-isoprenylcysteine O-methyltransferase Ste14